MYRKRALGKRETNRNLYATSRLMEMAASHCSLSPETLRAAAKVLCFQTSTWFLMCKVLKLERKKFWFDWNGKHVKHWTEWKVRSTNTNRNWIIVCLASVWRQHQNNQQKFMQSFLLADDVINHWCWVVCVCASNNQFSKCNSHNLVLGPLHKIIETHKLLDCDVKPKAKPWAKVSVAKRNIKKREVNVFFFACLLLLFLENWRGNHVNVMVVLLCDTLNKRARAIEKSAFGYYPKNTVFPFSWYQ